MGNQNYYYLVAGLPELSIEQGKLQFGTPEFREEMKNGLSREDYRLMQLLFLPEDNRNLLSLILKDEKKLSTEGVFSPEILVEEVREPQRLFPYMKNFVESQQAEAPLYPNLSPENELATLYYEEMLSVDNDFLQHWLSFELMLKNVLLVLSARKVGMKYENQVIGHDPLSELMKKSTSRDLGLSAEWPWIEKVLQIAEMENILTREKAIDLLRWNFLDELNTFNYFSVEVLMAYYIKLQMIERWLMLEPATGAEMFKKLLTEVQNSYEFPKELK